MASLEQNSESSSALGVDCPSSILDDPSSSSVWSDVGEEVLADPYKSPPSLHNWIPECAVEMKPQVGMVFLSIEAAFSFYRSYSMVCKFDIRRGSDKWCADGTVIRKYILCNKQGKNSMSRPIDSLTGSDGTRTVPSIMCGCNARISLKRNGINGYIVSQFVEGHNHPMATECGSQFLKSRRQLNFVHQRVVVDLSKINIGPVVAYKVYKGLVGGYSNIGATSSDFKNVQRDIIAYIGDFDAQMVIEKFRNKKEVCPSFFYEYFVEDGTLTRLFWADPISIQNCITFGDVMSFDATYSLNKYKMIFVPFTGLDNHKKSVTFAAALVSSEDAESYTWILQSFLKCMGRQPTMVLTDQDAALRKVVPLVFPESHHRFCMWHIMKKMSAKVGFTSDVSQEFRRQLSVIIYSNELEIDEFESGWNSLIEKYDFVGNVWLSNMFKLRRYWIPAYFRDIPLGCLVMTTSRSESQNSFFGRFLSIRMNLLAFMCGFESALENQRHTQAIAEHDSLLKKMKTVTPLDIEIDARDIYTIRIFADVQKEIVASCFDISVISLREVGKVKVYDLRDSKFTRHNYTVTHDLIDNDLSCSCKQYKRVGYQCRHVFYALRCGGIQKIPRKYILHRWTRNAIRLSGGVDDMFQKGDNSLPQLEPSTVIWSEFHSCLQLVADDTNKLELLTSRLKEMRIQLESESEGANRTDKKWHISRLIGATVPEQLIIKSPMLVHTKGSGKRIISERESAIARSKRPERICGICKKKGIHDKRTCPMKGISLPPVDRFPNVVADENIEI